MDKGNIVFISPHPDDELLGCGGTLLRLMRDDAIVCQCHWLIITDMTEAGGYSLERISSRSREIETVFKTLSFASVTNLKLPPARLDTIPMGDIVNQIGSALNRIRPNTVFLPYRGDAHSDHRIVFDAATACCKSFRSPWVKQLLTYETPSETDFGLDPDLRGFRPNIWVDISPYLEEKLRLLKIYQGELGAFPFPRSREAIEALARLRGSQAGVEAAESFMLLKWIF